MMDRNILELLERAVERFPDKPAFVSEQSSLTYAQLQSQARQLGSFLAANVPARQPVAVLMGHDVWAVAALMGIVSAGCFNIPLDPTQPADRVKKIFDAAGPAYILYDDAAKALVESYGDLPCPAISYAQAAATPVDEALLTQRRENASLLDPIQVFYTSGSTGQPKGVVHTHRSMLFYAGKVATWTDYVKPHQVWGNQAPFFYSNAIFDLFPPMNMGTTVYLIPANCFQFPQLFIEFFREKHIGTVLMTPMNFLYIADSGALTPGCMPDLEGVYICGEAMPYKQARQWLMASSHPDIKVSNFYGSTECPYVSVYPVLPDQDFEPGAILPSGWTLEGVRLVIMDENGDEAPQGQVGEMYVTAPWISCGYYKDPERTAAAFVSDPMHYGWEQLYYRSGDLGWIDEEGALHVQGRKDTQIKHRGYRMDLGEVEAALRSLPQWQNGCCLFSETEDKLYCFWCGTLTEKDIQEGLKGKIEKYMIPNEYVYLDPLPRTSSGKLDRMALRGYFKN